jgi:ATP-dependent Clp protease ATP-binding subunit ClpC
MFERFTESARQALFFARYETAQLGAISIETEHILLGLIRDVKGLVARILALSAVSVASIREEIEARAVFQENLPTSREIPFTAETKRILQFAADEADRLKHAYIGTEHLLLGVLREDSSVAASILIARGLRLDEVRNTIVRLLGESPSGADAPTRAEASARIDEIRRLVQALARLPTGSSEARDLEKGIDDRLAVLKRILGG